MSEGESDLLVASRAPTSPMVGPCPLFPNGNLRVLSTNPKRGVFSTDCPKYLFDETGIYKKKKK